MNSRLSPRISNNYRISNRDNTNNQKSNKYKIFDISRECYFFYYVYFFSQGLIYTICHKTRSNMPFSIAKLIFIR